jgi:hypothetical protein
MFVLYYLLFAFFTFIVVTVAGFVYLDWYWALVVSLITMLTLVQAGMALIRWRLRRMGRLFQELFTVKSQVLRGAAAAVHAVTRAAAPTRPLLDYEHPDDESQHEDEQEPAPKLLAWYCMDVTITPAEKPGPMGHWDLDDLRLVAGNARVPRSNDEDDTEPTYAPEEIEIEHEGRFRVAQEAKYGGPQRLRFLVGVPAELREVKFRYYFEEFGRIILPGR